MAESALNRSFILLRGFNMVYLGKQMKFNPRQMKCNPWTKILLILSLLLFSSAAISEVHIQATPDRGLQPRLISDDSGNIHLLYFKKRLRAPAAREGNLYYRQYLPEQNRFGNPVKVSSGAFNLQTFSIARAAIAIDGEGRIHAVWYRANDGEYFYARSNPERTQFEAQQSMVSEFAEGIDATADVAASGNDVAIVWAAGDLSREYERTVYARLSQDNGENFGEEFGLSNPDLGACAWCSLASDFIDDDLFVAYRSAIDGVGRHMQLLTLERAEGESIGSSYGPVGALQEWELSSCPLSTNDIVLDEDSGNWLVFETEYRIIQMELESEAGAMAVADPFVKTRQKNPALAFNGKDQRLIAWGEAISHARGGRLNMRLLDFDGEVEGFSFEEEITIPNYSFPAAASLPNGDFLVLY